MMGSSAGGEASAKLPSILAIRGGAEAKRACRHTGDVRPLIVLDHHQQVGGFGAGRAEGWDKGWKVQWRPHDDLDRRKEKTLEELLLHLFCRKKQHTDYRQGGRNRLRPTGGKMRCLRWLDRPASSHAPQVAEVVQRGARSDHNTDRDGLEQGHGCEHACQ